MQKLRDISHQCEFNNFPISPAKKIVKLLAERKKIVGFGVHKSAQLVAADVTLRWCACQIRFRWTLQRVELVNELLECHVNALRFIVNLPCRWHTQALC